MAKIKTTTWKLEPHTEAKHIILNKYLQAWIPIQRRFNQKVLYIDGFAGPGIYDNGEEGSPIIALKTLLNHKLLPLMKETFIFAFIEQNKERCEKLKEVISKIKLPTSPTIKTEIECGEFADVVGKNLDYIEKKNLTLAPSFVFIDPFGFKGIPLELIGRIMKNPKCEVLINFNYEDMSRWYANPENEKHYNDLFGTKEWKEVFKKTDNPKERENGLHNLYQRQMKKIAGIKYIRSFKMKNKSNKLDYFLFFGTNSLTGLNAMKEAMWKVDGMGRFEFSDYTYNSNVGGGTVQTVLFELEPNFGILKKDLLIEFKGKTVGITEIENFVKAETAFLTKHIRKPILDVWEAEKPPKIKVTYSGKRRPGTYPKDAEIAFL